MSNKSLVQYRWGRKRTPSALARVSVSTRAILDTIPDKYRREFIDAAVRAFMNSEWYRQKIQNR